MFLEGIKKDGKEPEMGLEGMIAPEIGFFFGVLQ